MSGKPQRPSLRRLGCIVAMLVHHTACALGGYAGPQIVVSSRGQVSLEIMVAAGLGPILTDQTTQDRKVAIRWLGIDGSVGYNFNNRKIAAGFGNFFSVGNRPAFAPTGHESHIGIRFRYGGGHGFQAGFHLQYAHVRVLTADRDFPRCPAEGSETQSWLGPTLGAEMLWSDRGKTRRANFIVGTAYGRDYFYQSGGRPSPCTELDTAAQSSTARH